MKLSKVEKKRIRNYVFFQLLQGNIEKEEKGWFQAVCEHWYEQGRHDSKENFKKAIILLRKLADLQNGPPLEKWRHEWEETMEDIYNFLNKHETE